MKNRYKRQQDIFSAHDLTVGVVGVGAVGRNVVLQLAAMGVKNISIVDFDTVEVENLAAQGFYEKDLGAQKVEAVKAAAALVNTEVKINCFDCLYKPDLLECDIVFSCVDSMDARKQIFEGEKGKAKLFLDGRMSAEVFEVIRIDLSDDGDLKFYLTTLFKDSEGYQERCTSKTTIYCANVTAAFLVCEFVKFSKGIQLNRYYEVNIYGQYITNSEAQPEDVDDAAETITVHEVHEVRRV